jgi:hypothetical protein
VEAPRGRVTPTHAPPGPDSRAARRRLAEHQRPPPRVGAWMRASRGPRAGCRRWRSCCSSSG